MTSAEVLDQGNEFCKWLLIVAFGGVPVVALIGFLSRDTY